MTHAPVDAGPDRPPQRRQTTGRIRLRVAAEGQERDRLDPLARLIRIVVPRHVRGVVHQIRSRPIEVSLRVGHRRPRRAAAPQPRGLGLAECGQPIDVRPNLLHQSERDRVLRLLAHDFHHDPFVVRVGLVVAA